MDVIVIGAGLAGLAAADRLQAAGHSVSVLERSDRAGGRLGVDAWGDFQLDRALETLHGGDRHLLDWIRSLDLSEELLPLRPLQIAQVFEGRARPIDPQSLGGVSGIAGMRLLDAARLLRWPRLMARYDAVLDPTAPERAASLDYRSVADFGRLYFGPRLTARWIAPEVEDVFGGDGGELSRVAALLTWRARATGRARSVVHGLPRAPLWRVAERAAERLPVRYGVAASVVEATKAGGFRVTCEGAAGGSEALDADAVVVATSAAAAAGLVAPIATPPERDYLASVAVGPEVVLALALSRAPTGLPQRIRVPRGEDQPMASLLLEPGLAGGRAPRDCGVALLRATDRFALANQGASGDVVEKGLLAGLARLLPHVASSVEHAVLNRRHAARPEFVVGSYRALDRFRRVQADRRAQGRRLYFAGDHLIGPTAEGSVVSGRRAAADLVADQAAL